MFAIIYPPHLQYNDYVFPVWADGIGWLLAFSSIIFIPIMAIVQLASVPGTFKQVSYLKIRLNQDSKQLFKISFSILDTIIKKNFYRN